MLASNGAAADELPWFPSPFEPICGRNFLSENYGLGLGAGYLGQPMITPSRAHATCRDLGLEKGAAVAREEADNQPWCQRAFERGLQAGLKADVPTIETPSGCWHIGYSFGMARVENAVRRGLVTEVGDRCLGEYRRGWDDAVEGRVPVVSFDNFLNHCFHTGYDDGAVWGPL